MKNLYTLVDIKEIWGFKPHRCDIMSEEKNEEFEGEKEKNKKMVYLSPVFLEGETLNKFSFVDNFVNCPRYISRSGATQEGCFWLKIGNENEVTYKETKGIFLVINEILNIDSSRKILWSVEEVFKLVKQINFRGDKDILIKWNNYGVTAFNKFRKGRIMKFEKIAEQGNLKIFKVPFPREGFNYNGEMKEGVWEGIKEIQIYNHKLYFDQEVKIFKNLHTMPGDGILVWVEKDNYVRAESPNHGSNIFSLSNGLGMGFYLFSHPKPKRSID